MDCVLALLTMSSSHQTEEEDSNLSYKDLRLEIQMGFLGILPAGRHNCRHAWGVSMDTQWG